MEGGEKEGASKAAILALVLGVLSFLGGGPITGIPAWIVGGSEMRRIDSGGSPAAGRTMAKAGMILGIIATVVVVLAGLAFLAFWQLADGLARGIPIGAPARQERMSFSLRRRMVWKRG